jgi:hypothetical protein
LGMLTALEVAVEVAEVDEGLVELAAKVSKLACGGSVAECWRHKRHNGVHARP